VEAALLQAGARRVGGGRHEEAQAVLPTDEHRRQPLQHGAVCLGGPRHLERGPEVHVHQHALALGALGAGGEEDVQVRVLAGGVGGGLVPAGEAGRGVVPRGAEGLGQQTEEVALARARRAVALDQGGDVREEVALPERRAVDEALGTAARDG